MKLPFGLSWLPGEWRWAALSEADRLMLTLSLSLLLHAPLFMRLPLAGSLHGQPQTLSVRLSTTHPARPHAEAARMIRPPPATRPHSSEQVARVLQQPRGRSVLHHDASAVPASAALPSAPAPSLADAATTLPMPVNAESAATDSAAQQLGLDFYYAAPQLDVLALEQLPIQLVAPYGVGMDEVDVNLRIYINEQGTVDAVQLVSARPAGVEAPLLEIFRSARFYPAIRDGQPVKSFKVIHIGPQQGGDTQPSPDN